MLTSSSLSVLISILALIASLWSVSYGLKYAKTNVLHSIQKLMLDKAKDCNILYISEREKWIKLVQEGDYNFYYLSTIDEIVKSIQLLDNSLSEYSHEDKKDFFLKQFWIQLDNGLRHYFEMYKEPTGLRSPEIEKTKLIIKTLNVVHNPQGLYIP